MRAAKVPAQVAAVPAQAAAPSTAPVTAPITAPATVGSTVPAGTTFAGLGVPAALIAALAAQGITAPFPIQAASLPDTLAGRDVLGRGRTGSGKTVAFAVPTVAALVGSRRPRRAGRPRSLVLVPTRELATQVAATVEPLAKAVGMTVTTVFGGVGQGRQVAALKAGIDVLIACPGRLEDLLQQGHLQLDAVEVTVLDEADHMADLGFLPGVKRILDRTPKGTQRLLFSATLDNGIDVLVKRYLADPVTHSVDPAVAPVSTMAHHVFAVTSANKAAVIHDLAGGRNRTLLFTRTKHSAKRLARQLTAAGVPAVDLHGNLAQNARARNLAQFADGTVKVLVATDIAARGIHVDDVSLVVHVDPPADHKAYLHRSGRTARAGAEGTVVTLMLPEQQAEMRTLARQAGIRPVTATAQPGAAEIAALTGPKVPLVEPVAVQRPAAQRPAGRSAQSSGRSAQTSGRSGRTSASAKNGSSGESRPSGGSRPSRRSRRRRATT